MRSGDSPSLTCKLTKIFQKFQRLGLERRLSSEPWASCRGSKFRLQHITGSQVPGTLALGDLMPSLDCHEHCTHIQTHTCVCVCAYVHACAHTRAITNRTIPFFKLQSSFSKLDKLILRLTWKTSMQALVQKQKRTTRKELGLPG